MCQLCVELVPIDSLHVDENGEKWDVCESCHQADKINHDPLCPNLPCTCDPDDYGHEWTCQKLCQCDIIRAAYQRGYKEAEKFYTNSCMLCGYAGEWSTYICDDCIERQNNVL